MMMMMNPSFETASATPAPKPSFWGRWLMGIEQTLLAPQSFFETVVKHHAQADEWDTPYVRQGLLCVLLVAFVVALQPAIIGKLELNAFDAVLTALGAVVFWGFQTLLISTAGYVFKGHAKANSLLALFGFAGLPWLLWLPISILKVQLAPFGFGFIYPFLALGLWGWSTFLFLKALAVSYELNTERLIVLSMIPLIGVCLLILGFGTFFNTLAKVFFA
jgi:hypothetical protein